MSKIGRLTILGAVLGMAMLAGCHRTPAEAVQLHRLDKVLFETPVEQLQGKLQQVRDEYATELLALHPEDADFMQMLEGFVADPTMRDIYRLVDSVLGDMQPQAKELGSALKRAEELCPTMRYDKVYTYVSGMFDYNMRVGCNSHEMIISVDQYVLPYTERYGYFGCPLFLVQQSRPEYMVADCMTAIAREHIAIPQEDAQMSGQTPSMTLLDYMVAEGKAIYFAQQVLPDAPDSILMRYTADQTEWMKANEEHVWSYFMQNRLLYETDYMRFHNLIDDAPKTNAFRDSSPRTTDYIGWRIVSQYMKNSGCTMQELFDETDAQKILNQSNYRPK